MDGRRRIAVLTGIRSEYDILFSPMNAIQHHPGLELQVLVTGAHLSPRFGSTVHQIEEDGFPIADRIESLLDSDTAGSRIRSGAVQLLGVTQAFERLRPEFILVCGDREEALTGALAGVYMNIAVAHIAGGDLVVGNVDDSVRHAVTRLAHLHFPFSAESAARLQRMGEEPWRIHAVGNPALDRYGLVKPLTREELSDHLAFDVTEGPLLLVLQHTISSEFEAAGAQMRETMEAIADLGFRTVVSYPNSDAGSREMIRVIEEFAAKLPFIRVFRSLPRVDFVNLVRVVDVLVGNSSMGLLEAPFLRLPAVNIGNRQMSRQHADNVIFVPHERDAVKQAIRTALNDRSFRAKLETSQHLFGDGYSGSRVAQVLASTPLDRRLLVKGWTV